MAGDSGRKTNGTIQLTEEKAAPADSDASEAQAANAITPS
jgi:hypothetical protein